MARFMWQLERTTDACCDDMVTDFLDILGEEYSVFEACQLVVLLVSVANGERQALAAFQLVLTPTCGDR